RPPVLLVLLDQKIHKPEHPENPPCENPGKQWPSHGVLLIVVRSHVLSTEYGNDRSFIGKFQPKGKTIMERGFSKNIRSPCQGQTTQHLPALRQRADSSTVLMLWWTVKIDRGSCLVRCAILDYSVTGSGPSWKTPKSQPSYPRKSRDHNDSITQGGRNAANDRSANPLTRGAIRSDQARDPTARAKPDPHQSASVWDLS